LLAGQLDPSTKGALLSVAIPMHALLGREYQAELDDMVTLFGGGVTGYDPSLLLARMWAAFAAGDLGAIADIAPRVAAMSVLNAPPALALAARVAVLQRRADRVRAALDGLAATGIRGPTIDGQRAVAEAGLLALEGDWQGAASLLSTAIRAASDNGLLFDVTLAWLAVIAVAPAGDSLAERAQAEVGVLIEQTGFIALRPLLERLVRERGSTPAGVARDVDAAASTTPA
jgi:hypothetical protein